MIVEHYEPPTAEQWLAIAAAITTKTGFSTTVEGGGAACPFIRIALPDGRIVLFGDVNETWTGDLYVSQAAEERGEIMNEVAVYTDVPNSEHDAYKIAKAFQDGITDVCIVGNPAILGRCGEPDCIC